MNDKKNIENSDKSVLDYKDGLTEGFRETEIDSPLKCCTCAVQYTIENSINGLQLFYGRCYHRHGWNLCTLTERAHNFNPHRFVEMLNKADEWHKFYLNGIELVTGVCDAHSGENTPPWYEFSQKYIRCPVCDYHEIEALRHQVLLLADRLDQASKSKGI